MVKKVPLSQGLFALVDDADFALVSEHSWRAVRGGRTYYARSPEMKMQMHRLLLGACDKVVDHINGDGLDNRRENLRFCAVKENIRNQRKRIGTTSVFKGVSWKRATAKWSVCIEQNSERLWLGTFDSEIRAAKQYDRAARIFHGQFAKTNESLGLFNGAKDRLAPRF